MFTVSKIRAVSAFLKWLSKSFDINFTRTSLFITHTEITVTLEINFSSSKGEAVGEILKQYPFTIPNSPQ